VSDPTTPLTGFASERLAAIESRFRSKGSGPAGGASFETLLAEAQARQDGLDPFQSTAGARNRLPGLGGARGDGRLASTAGLSTSGSVAGLSGSVVDQLLGRLGGSTGTATGLSPSLLANAGLSGLTAFGSTALGSTAGQAVVEAGKTHLGVPYLWGGTDAENGFDCSGLVQDAYRRIGVEMPKWSRHQATMGVEVGSIDEALPGDVLAFGHPVNHVALYVGDGKMLHAPKSGEVVKVESIDRPIATIRRIVTPGAATFGLSPTAGSSVYGASGASQPTSELERVYQPVFEAAGERWGIDPALLAGVASTESGFDREAVSSAGAQGLMQFMPATAAEMGVDPWDPASAIDGAARYLRQSLDQFDTVEEAIASYNAGRGAVSRYGGVPPFPETQNYVRKVLDAWRSRS
jgi:cell wall-associated NlpC family hydrolase